MGVELKKIQNISGHDEVVLKEMEILDPNLFSQIIFDYRGFKDSRTTLATAPEAASTIETATHGFSIGDGQIAVQFIKTRDDGTTVTFQLCEGARGTACSDLAQYGNEKLKEQKLGTHSEFEEMVDELDKEVKGLMVAKRELQTEDDALKLAFEIVQRGVYTEGGGSWVEFKTEDKDGGEVVSDSLVLGWPNKIAAFTFVAIARVSASSPRN
jgi:hypothetical protein